MRPTVMQMLGEGELHVEGGITELSLANARALIARLGPPVSIELRQDAQFGHSALARWETTREVTGGTDVSSVNGTTRREQERRHQAMRAEQPGLVLSLFPGIGLLDRAFEQEGFCIVRGPDLLWGGDVRLFHPPAGRFDGIIGGPPCQVNVKRGKGNAPDLIPQFSRCVQEALPRWFVMENVPLAPDPKCPGFYVWSQKLNNRMCPTDDSGTGAEQNRLRRFWFGIRRDLDPVDFLMLEVAKAERENPVWSAAVTANGISKPGTEHQRGKKDRRLYGWSSWKNLRKALRWQGFPENMLDESPFTLKGAFKVVGNGVPLPMGLAIARAVKKALTLTEVSSDAT